MAIWKPAAQLEPSTTPPMASPLPSLPSLPSLRVLGHSAVLPSLQQQPLVVPPLQRREARVVPAPLDRVKRKRGRPCKNTTTIPPGGVDGLAAARRTRKSAYQAQKEAHEHLNDEVQQLEERLDQLRLQAGLPTKADRRQLTSARVRNAEIDTKIHLSRRIVVQLRSQLMAELRFPAVNPLASYIHLPCDMDERRAILRGMKEVKLRRAAEMGIAWFRHMDATKPFMSQERFVTDDGVHHCNRWEMNSFPHFKSAKQMYEVVRFWIYNLEISVTEMVNQVAVREDDGDDAIEQTIWNQRIVTTTEDVGCVEELNTVGFAQFYDNYDLLNGEPLGIIAVDTVDEDDLYPYKPAERTRKDVQTFHLFREVVDPQTRRKLVVFQVGVVNAQLPPQFPVAPHVLEKLYKYMPRWTMLKNQYLSEYTVPP